MIIPFSDFCLQFLIVIALLKMIIFCFCGFGTTKYLSRYRVSTDGIHGSNNMNLVGVLASLIYSESRVTDFQKRSQATLSEPHLLLLRHVHLSPKRKCFPAHPLACVQTLAYPQIRVSYAHSTLFTHIHNIMARD
jgi:hypothetical protein